MRDRLGIVIAFFLAAGFMLLAFISGIGSWLVEQVVMIEGGHWPRWGWLLWGMGNGFLVLLPMGLLTYFWTDKSKPLYRSWAIAGSWMMLISLARWTTASETTSLWLGQILLQLLFLLIYGRLSGLRIPLIPRWSQASWAALFAAFCLLLPWAQWGALGSLLETLLLLANSWLWAQTAVLLLASGIGKPLSMTENGSFLTFTWAGFAAGITLLLLALNWGVGGTPIMLIMLLPASGWLFIYLVRYAADWSDPAPIWFLTLIAAAPHLFVDADEFQLLLGGSEIPTWGMSAAALSMLFAWGGGFAAACLFHWRRKQPSPLSPRLFQAGAAGMMLLFVAVYTAGQPGFYGEQMFVILKEQAVLQLDTAESPEARRQMAYDQLTAHAESTQSDLRQTLDRFGVRYQPYYLVNGIQLSSTPWLHWWLARQPEVDRILMNPVLRPLPVPLAAATGNAIKPTKTLWNIEMVGAPQVWSEFAVTGEGIVIGLSDSGVDWHHPALQAQYRGGENNHDYHWFDPWNKSIEPVDLAGHGTHTAGSILGDGIGVAPGATWFGCTNLARNLANPTFYLDCMQFMLAPFPQGGDPLRDGNPALGAHILNNSWGCPALEGCDANALLPAVRALRAAGLFVVASAGNEGSGGCSTIADPIALYDEVFSVGAVNDNGYLAGFSSLGPVTADGSMRIKPDIAAPGVSILSAFPNNSYEYADGTSMAGPHVAGVVALLWSAAPELIGEIELTEQLLQESARPYAYPEELPCSPDNLRPNNGVGYGLVDAYGAVKAALEQRED